jgi:hypothetical protein
VKSKLSVGSIVHVDGPANQPPFERIVDEGVILSWERQHGYLVQLHRHKENLLFRRQDLSFVSRESQ